MKIVFGALLCSSMLLASCGSESSDPPPKYILAGCACNVAGAPSHARFFFYDRKPNAFGLTDVSIEVRGCSHSYVCGNEGVMSDGKFDVSELQWDDRPSTSPGPPDHYYFARGKVSGNSYLAIDNRTATDKVDQCWKNCDEEGGAFCQGVPANEKLFSEMNSLFDLIRSAQLSSSDSVPTRVGATDISKIFGAIGNACERDPVIVSPRSFFNAGKVVCVVPIDTIGSRVGAKGAVIIPVSLVGRFADGSEMEARFEQNEARPRLRAEPPDELLSGEILGLRKIDDQHGVRINYVVASISEDEGRYSMFPE